MIDFFLAMMAAGINSADGADTGDAAIAEAVPSAIVEPLAVVPEAVTEVAPAPTAPIGDTLATVVPTPAPSASVNMGSGVIIGEGVLLEGIAEAPTAEAATPLAVPTLIPEAPAAPTTPGMNMAVVPAGLVAEPQTPSGKFTTAAEVKPILNATKGSWVAVREFNGQDLLYVTHIWSWRCGLHAMAISVNGEPMQNWPLPECHMKYTTPSAILEEDGLPYLTFRLGSVETIDIQIVYDDLSMDAVRFDRGNILIP